MREGKEAKAILCFCFAYLLSKSWTLFPESDTLYRFFLFKPEIQLTLRMHLWFVCRIAEIIAIYCGVSMLIERFRWEITVILVLYMLDLPDYLLIYQEALFYIGHWPIEFGLIKGIIIIFIAAKTYLQWKH